MTLTTAERSGSVGRVFNWDHIPHCWKSHVAAQLLLCYHVIMLPINVQNLTFSRKEPKKKYEHELNL